MPKAARARTATEQLQDDSPSPGAVSPALDPALIDQHEQITRELLGDPEQVELPTPKPAPEEVSTAPEPEPAPKEPEKAPDTSAEVAESLKRELAEAKERLAASEARSRAAEQQASTASRSAADAAADAEGARIAAVDNAIAADNQDIASARLAIRRAVEAGDVVGQADAIEMLADAKGAIRDHERTKQWLTAQRQQRLQAPPPAPGQDWQIEAHIARTAQDGMPRSAQWLREHRQFYTDQGFREKVERAHFKALGEGIPADSDRYFELIEQAAGTRQAPGTAAATAPAEAVRVAPPVSAPVSREAPGGGGSRTIRIPVEAQQFAKNTMGITKPAEIAEWWSGLDDDGRRAAKQMGWS